MTRGGEEGSVNKVEARRWTIINELNKEKHWIAARVLGLDWRVKSLMNHEACLIPAPVDFHTSTITSSPRILLHWRSPESVVSVLKVYQLLIFPEPIVVKPFHLKEGAWEGTEVKQLLSQLAKFALVINIFLLPPALFIEYTLNPLYLERDSSSLFCVHISTCSLEQRLIAPVKMSRGSSSFCNYGSRESESLLNRKGTIVYTREATRVLSLNTEGLAFTRWQSMG